MGLTVVTHVNYDFSRNRDRCMASVAEALTENCKHTIIDTTGASRLEFMIARYDAMKLDDIVVFVDDDDYITPNSLKYCYKALTENDAGIAFTQEVRVDNDGKEHLSTKPRLSKICNSPVVVHHMTAFNTKYVTDRSIKLLLENELGIEWIMKADAAANAGAIFIPMIGYYWVQHAGQHHRQVDCKETANRRFRNISNELNKWGIPDINIPELSI